MSTCVTDPAGRRRWPALLALPVAVALLAGTGCGTARPAPGTGASAPAGTGASGSAGSGGPSGSPAASVGTPGAGSVAPAAGPAHFDTLPPGARLPSGSQCATWVQARPVTENKRVNQAANQTTGQHVSGSFFSGDRASANRDYTPRIDGQFTGTTAQILRWGACKWGIDEDIVKAQAAIESWWQQTAKGDYGTDAAACPAGHAPGVDGTAGKCPQSYGILQVRYPYMGSAFPGALRSTAMNVDVAYAVWRACFEGYEDWLNTVERGEPYGAGDAWGCVGRWFSGRWHTSDSNTYVAQVRDYLAKRIWQQADFQQR